MSDVASRTSSPVQQVDTVLGEHKRKQSIASKTSSSSEVCHPSQPPTKIIGVLHELKDDIVTCPQQCNTSVTGSSRALPCVGPSSGQGDVYVEQNGKFVKVSKDLVDSSDFYTKTVYLEEVGTHGYTTPLDIAIMVEKGCSTISRILLGLLAGVALLKLLLVTILNSSWQTQDIILLGEFYSILVGISSTLFLIIFPVCLVSLFDWLDLAHADLQHLVDTLIRRKIFFVILLYFSSFIVFLVTVPYNDFIIFSWTSKLSFLEQELLKNMDVWKSLTTAYCILALLGWFVVGMTRNEDLFYIHLISMKKYEDEEAHLTFENQLACHQLYS